MPRPRKPTQVLELSGAYKKNPKRKAARANEPVVDTPLGQPPAYFTEEQRATWQEIVSRAPDGLLTTMDFFVVEMAAVELTNYRKDLSNASQARLLANLWSKLGYNPADRSKVVIPQKPKESRWARFSQLKD